MPRGYRVSLAHAWSGTSFLRTVDSTRDCAVYRTYRADPFTRGRNLFALRLVGMTSIPTGRIALPIERRFLPGGELVRGFRRGGLSPWVYGGDGNVQPAGADMVFGGSSEYRVPLRGPVSGAAFADFGWTSLDGRIAGASPAPPRIVEKTNSLFRLSVGGELRLQLPVLNQPARLIFSWNPIRLDSLIAGPSGLMRLSDPRRALHLALGNLF